MPRNYAPIKENKEWTWRTNPRTVDRMLDRFRNFAKLEGRIYNSQTKSIYSKAVNYNSQTRGRDAEAQARQDKSTFEMFGLAYIDEEDKIKITDVGRIFLDEEQKELWSNLFLRQLMKFQVPNYTQSTNRYSDFKIFPLKLILDLLTELGSLSYYEIGLVCFNTLTNTKKDLDKAVSIINEFRSMLLPGEIRANIERVFNQLYVKYWGYNPRSVIDKARPFSVFLEYTNLFVLSGRGNFTKIRIREFFKKQADEIRDFNFIINDEYSSLSFFDLLGNPNYPKLPYEVPEKLKEIIIYKSSNLELEKIDTTQIIPINEITELQKIDVKIDNILLKQQKKKYKEIISKTVEERITILDGLVNIEENEDGINLPALKLEEFTWKSLIALEGTHEVKENFKLNPDLSIKNFAHGYGNTPDIELYNQNYIFIVEVSLTKGKGQLESEGIPVLDHINKFIKVKTGKKLSKTEEESLKDTMIKPTDARKIIGIFVAREVDDRVLRQFYFAGKTQVYDDLINVVPFNLKQYVTLISFCYKNNVPALEFEKLMDRLSENINKTKDYSEWIKMNELELKTFLS